MWRWAAGILAALIASNIGTAFAFRTTPDEIIQTVQSRFTDISNQQGMYVVEGRPRIESLEIGLKAFIEKSDGRWEQHNEFAHHSMQILLERIARIESDVGYLKKRAEEK
jgi:hypothetical protein